MWRDLRVLPMSALGLGWGCCYWMCLQVVMVQHRFGPGVRTISGDRKQHATSVSPAHHKDRAWQAESLGLWLSPCTAGAPIKDLVTDTAVTQLQRGHQLLPPH